MIIGIILLIIAFLLIARARLPWAIGKWIEVDPFWTRLAGFTIIGSFILDIIDLTPDYISTILFVAALIMIIIGVATGLHRISSHSRSKDIADEIIDDRKKNRDA